MVKINFGRYKGKWLKGIVIMDCKREDIIASPMGSYGVYVYFKQFIRGRKPKYGYTVVGDHSQGLENLEEAHVVWIGRVNRDIKIGWT